MSFGGQPLEFYDRPDCEEYDGDKPFVVAGCLIKPMWGVRFRVEDKYGKHLGTFSDVNDAIEHAKLKGDPADIVVEDVRNCVDDDDVDIPF